MLNVFRENLRHLKWILWIVAGTFVVFFGTAWYTVTPNQGGGAWVAMVNGQEVSNRLWEDRARRMDNQYRQAYGNRWGQIRDQVDVPRRAAEELVNRELIVQDARRLGLRVTDAELADYIRSLPAFQRDGRFIGSQQYSEAIRRGLFGSLRDPDEFADALRGDLLQDKWFQLLATSVVITPEEVEAEFRPRHERVTFEYIALPLDELAKEIEPSDAELAAWYDAHRDRYAVGEARRALYVLIDDAVVSGRIEIGDDEIARYYEENRSLFTRPEERRVRQVLIRVTPDAPAAEIEAARERARAVAERIRAGEDFAEVARETSDDEISAASGGDMGFFPRGRMVPQFDEKVFSLEPGVV